MGVSADESQGAILQRISEKERKLERLKQDRRERELNAKIEHEEAVAAGRSVELPLRLTDSRSAEEEGQGQGRRSDAPTQKAQTKKYFGKNISEYQTFIMRLENHFMMHDSYYTEDKFKIGEAICCMSNSHMVMWTRHSDKYKKEHHQLPTFKEFKDYLLGLIKDPKILAADANQQYHDARQRPGQPVREFVTC